MNTKIEYLYRDADNYKVWNSCVIAGVLTKKQKRKIQNCLLDGEYFVPSAVGLPEKTFVDLGFRYDEAVDHRYFELSLDDIQNTDETPTVEINTKQLVRNFLCMSGKCWGLAEKLIKIVETEEKNYAEERKLDSGQPRKK